MTHPSHVWYVGYARLIHGGGGGGALIQPGADPKSCAVEPTGKAIPFGPKAPVCSKPMNATICDPVRPIDMRGSLTRIPN